MLLLRQTSGSGEEAHRWTCSHLHMRRVRGTLPRDHRRGILRNASTGTNATAQQLARSAPPDGDRAPAIVVARAARTQDVAIRRSGRGPRSLEAPRWRPTLAQLSPSARWRVRRERSLASTWLPL